MTVFVRQRIWSVVNANEMFLGTVNNPIHPSLGRLVFCKINPVTATRLEAGQVHRVPGSLQRAAVLFGRHPAVDMPERRSFFEGTARGASQVIRSLSFVCACFIVQTCSVLNQNM